MKPEQFSRLAHMPSISRNYRKLLEWSSRTPQRDNIQIYSWTFLQILEAKKQNIRQERNKMLCRIFLQPGVVQKRKKTRWHWKKNMKKKVIHWSWFFCSRIFLCSVTKKFRYFCDSGFSRSSQYSRIKESESASGQWGEMISWISLHWSFQNWVSGDSSLILMAVCI